VHVRLKKKLASVMDGVDVSHVRAGDILQLPDADAELLISEGWAERVAEDPGFETVSQTPASD
jgi:hypothetical protein